MVMLRSVLVPGWGQWANGKHLKAIVVAGGEGYLIYRAVHAGRLESDARDQAKRDPDRETAWLAEADKFNEERRKYTWWGIFAVVLSMGDAYVDAHLRGFDVEFEPQDQGKGWRAGVRLCLN
jgi:hypothetical protein